MTPSTARLHAEANSSVHDTPGFLIQAAHKHQAEPASFVRAEVGRYRLRLAQTVDDRDEACRLRFKVFNIELGEGLEHAYSTGMDADQFDFFCDHLLVEDKLTRRIVGTYRMQSGESAARGLGYYSQQEFHLDPYERLRPYVLELGRASIDREHRTPEVLTLLWRGIAQYAIRYGLRYLIGCSSIHSQDPHEGWAMYHVLHSARCAPEFATTPTAGYRCPVAEPAGSAACDPNTPSEVKVPRLLKAYLAIGARICSPPAWDRAFGTIDFLTLLDLKALSPAARHRFLGSAAS